MAVDGQRFMTKTQHYRKVTKPLLERKRRARMNLYLDELKDLIVDTMEAQGEHITKLEKADILEMTVNYLRTHKHEIAANAQTHTAVTGAPEPNGINVEKFRAGYTQAAYEVSKVFATVPGLDLKFGTRLMKHLGYQLKDIRQTPLQVQAASERQLTQTADLRPSTAVTSNHKAQSGQRHSPQALDLHYNNNNAEAHAKGEDVWRPW